jgi:hypothetical protein
MWSIALPACNVGLHLPACHHYIADRPMAVGACNQPKFFARKSDKGYNSTACVGVFCSFKRSQNALQVRP